MMTNAATAAAASSRRSKKDFDGERRSKRKAKAKSGKRRRLRDESDSSPSSGTDEDPRPRRTRAKKSERRKRAPRNASTKLKRSKKRVSRKKRYRSLSPSSGYSSRSCSTCRSSSSGSSSVSRSPPPKARLKERSRSRGRGRDGESERGRSRRRRRRTTSNDGIRKSRNRSRSFSTCAGSWNSGPSGCRSSKKYEEMEGQMQLRSKSPVEDGREVVEVSGNDVVSDGIIQAYDDFDRYDGRRSDNDQEFHGSHERDDWAYAMDNQLVGGTVAEKHTVGNAGVGKDDFAPKEGEDNSGTESVNLESQLRQKALENFKKFQRSLSGNTRSPGHQEDEAKQSQCHNEAQTDLANTRILEWQQSIIKGEVWPSKCRVRSVVILPDEEDTSGLALRQPYSNENSGEVNNSGLDINEGQKNVVQLKRIIETSNEASLVQLKKIKETSNEASLNTSPMKEKQEKNINASSLNSITKDADMNQPSGQPTLLLSSQQNFDSGNENKEDTGSQFQQKTFSRMHEGEVVEVSYKVYIPKRAPALARRQLER
ncbi:nipped-B-like protein B [Zingiber officinale]|uniref:nipped-B-like protein B n=1 Tax=Zingiber officinale TaxID=94328 RepID=UPI001C4B081D|nr:nipped-B-like protein B [Zingiber officinale]